MPEPKQTTLDTLAEMLAEYKREIDRLNNHVENLKLASEPGYDLMCKIRELEDRLADCAKQNKFPTVHELATAKKNTELEIELANIKADKSEISIERNRLFTEKENLLHLIEELKKQNNITRSDEYVAELREDNERLSCLNREQVKMLEVEQEQLKLKDVLIQELRKEKEHYEKVAQEQLNRADRNAVEIGKLKTELEEFKSNNRFHRGHTEGYQEAIKMMKVFLETRK